MDKAETTTITQNAAAGDAASAKTLMPLVYEELLRISDRLFRCEDAEHTLQPTAVVHEAYIKLVDHSRIDWQGRTHFIALASTTLRRILIDHARKRKAQKRGGGWKQITLDTQGLLPLKGGAHLLDLDEALCELEKVDPRAAEIIELRFFGGLTVSEVARHLSLAERTIGAQWTWAKAWLYDRLR